MTEEQLRAIVREEIARALGHPAPPRVASQPPSAPPRQAYGPSHLLFTLAPPREGDACVIEPAVVCTGCGYCKTLGH